MCSRCTTRARARIPGRWRSPTQGNDSPGTTQQEPNGERIAMNTAVKPIPSGMHTLTPHLVVKGASKAIEFYKKAFGAEEVGRLNAPDGKTVMHADLKIGDSHVFLVDEF